MPPRMPQHVACTNNFRILLEEAAPPDVPENTIIDNAICMILRLRFWRHTILTYAIYEERRRGSRGY